MPRKKNSKLALGRSATQARQSRLAPSSGLAPKEAIPHPQPSQSAPTNGSAHSLDEIPMGCSRPIPHSGLAHVTAEIQTVFSRPDPNSVLAQLNRDTHSVLSQDATNCGAQYSADTQTTTPPANSMNGGAHTTADTQSSSSPAIQSIMARYRQYQAWLRAVIRLELQAQALCRSYTEGDKTAAQKLWASILKGSDADPTLMATLAPFISSITVWRKGLIQAKKALDKAAKDTPYYEMLPKGFGSFNLAALLGEAGEIADYRNPSSLWKRLGLAVIDGERQRKCTDKAKALAHAYNPRRRAAMYVLGTCLIKAKGPMKDIYNERKAFKLAAGWTKAHAHNDAMRFMTKRAIRDLWIAAQPAREMGPSRQFGKQHLSDGQPKLSTESRMTYGDRLSL